MTEHGKTTGKTTRLSVLANVVPALTFILGAILLTYFVLVNAGLQTQLREVHENLQASQSNAEDLYQQLLEEGISPDAERPTDVVPSSPGSPGANGTDGRDGARGEKGDRGDQGDIGIPGQTGPPGPAGQAGTDGTPGSAGGTGDPGPAGSAGADGAPGAPGSNGADGATPVAVTCETGGSLAFTMSDGRVLTTQPDSCIPPIIPTPTPEEGATP